MKRKKSGFIRHISGGLVRQTCGCGGMTLVELLIVLAIISLLVGLLLPALGAVRKAAREAKQTAQITTIDLALSAFKNDDGDYPPSVWSGSPSQRYCGSQKLAEALLGWDLMGFHPKSAWRADGLDENGGEWTYDPAKVRGDATLHERKGPYLELATANAFRLGRVGTIDGLFDPTGSIVAPEPYVICDVFGVKKITLSAAGKTAIAGTPILYYKANTSSKNIDDPDTRKRIYDVGDNEALVALGRLADQKPHKLENPTQFYWYIKDPKVTAMDAAGGWPYRPDSYILISAGADGNYGTEDDIRNFGY
jgi:prepilin-type N-terminal cleavage/methylation domain-containing protein